MSGSGPEGREVAAPMGRVSMVGAGQVGTMLGIALRMARPPGLESVTLFDRDPDAARASLERGAGDGLATSMDQAIRADTIVLALPVPQIVMVLDEFGAMTAPGSMVIDTGSAKATVVQAMGRALPHEVHAIGGHPMAGTERPGPGGADVELLRDAPFALTPVREDPVALEAGRSLAVAVGARPLVVAADVHDRTVALTSHLPHLLAFALASAAGRAAGSSSFEPALASTGYRGATRLAGSDAGMAAGFLAANAPGVAGAVASFRDELDRLLAAMEGGTDPLSAALAAAQVLAGAMG